MLRLTNVAASSEYPPLHTPLASFYHPLVTTAPTILPERWMLSVVSADGTIDRLSYDELVARPYAEVDATLWSAYQHPDEPRLATGRWRGVWLRQLFPQSTRGVTVTSANGQSACLDEGMLARGLLAYAVNGQQIPAEHGSPARIIIPGAYDHQMPGWVRRITCSPTGVTPPPPSRADNPCAIMASIEIPDAATRHAPIHLRGYAYAGLHDIDSVELSIDEAEWIPLEWLRGEAGVWSRWRAAWTPSHGGLFQVSIRARAGRHSVVTRRIIRVEAAQA